MTRERWTCSCGDSIQVEQGPDAVAELDAWLARHHDCAYLELEES